MMTFEEYKKLAQHPPRKEQETIFVLSSKRIDELPERCRQHYPEYDLLPAYEMAYCHTLEAAEAIMKEDVALHDGQEDFEVFCYEIRERGVNRKLYACTVVSHRIYDGRGCLLDETRCASGDTTPEDYIYSLYRGRTEEQMRFKPGDIVEFVAHGGKVALGFVISQPPTVEECWRAEQRMREYYGRYSDADTERPHNLVPDEETPPYCGPDDSEDCYIVLTNSNYISHHHVHITCIFAPHFPIPPYMRKKLETAYRRFVEKEAKE